MKIILFINITALLTITNFGLCHKYEEIPEVISNEVQKLKTSKTIPNNLTKAIKNLTRIHDKKVSNDIFCQTCNLVIEQIIGYRKSGADKDSMAIFLRKLCDIFTDWGPVACVGYISIEIDTILYIIDNKENLTSARSCAILFQYKNCQDPNANKWKIAIPPPDHQHRYERSHHHHHHHKHGQFETSPLKILHLTDIHYDPLYKAGNNADCDVPLCCQESNGPPAKPGNAAGYWGDYHVCDMPWYSITDLMNHVTNNHSHFDYIYYTGDIISHRSWATDKESNTQAIKKIYELFKTTFNTTPVYAVLGNHESHPSDFYSPGNVTDLKVSTQWLFDVVAEEWSRWLPNNTKTTIFRGGYYTVLVKPKFRIIALNSNVCYTSNLWLIYYDEDPYDQLKWLVDVLTEAEKNGEIVHLLSHIPPGEKECLHQWTSQFRRIVDRFSKTIVAQFNGHTHLDELRLFYGLNNSSQVINVAFNGGSFTTFVGLNPNYRVYDVDQSNYRVLDYDQYTFNLTKANQDQTKSPEWYKLYSFKEAYGLQNLSLDSLDDLVKKMSENHSLLQTYFRYQVRESKPEMAKGCNEKCQISLLCSITAVEARSAINCG